MAKNSDLDFKTTDNLKTKKEDIKEVKTEEKNSSTNDEHKDTHEVINDVIVEDIVVEENATLNDTELRSEIENLKQEIIDSNNKMFRVAADAANAAKQNILEIDNAKKAAKKQIVKNLLPFLTTIVLSFGFVPDNEESIKYVNQLKNSLSKLNSDFDTSNVRFIMPKVGEPFDATTMQALNATDQEEPLIKNVVSVGCIVDNQVIQPASVLI
jgi:molecular chaperone GrpE (heat shock protein)